MIRRLIAAALVVTGLGLVVLGPSAGAADVVATGWWSRTATTDPLSESPQPLPFPRPTTPDTIPIGATVGEDQLLVEGTPEGATAVAAIRWQLAEGESSPSLTLPISPTSTVGPNSLVLACRAGAAWTPPESVPARWEAKPLVDGQACINGIIADDLSTISFGLQPLVRKQVLDLVLVPGRLAEVPEIPAGRADGSAFRWVFDSPTPESLETVQNSGFEQGSGPVVVTQPPVEQSAPPATEGPSVDSSGPRPTVAPKQVATAAPSGDTSTAVTPALEPDELASAAAPEQVQLAVDGDDAPRTVGLILLLLGAAFGAWAYLSPQPEADMVGLGRFRRAVVPVGGAVAGASAAAGAGPAEAPTGGLGRFAQPRREPPVPIH